MKFEQRKWCTQGRRGGEVCDERFRCPVLCMEVEFYLHGVCYCVSAVMHAVELGLFCT